jgi:hypothetical protein
MKFHRKRIRLLKGLAFAGCALGLAAPSVAGAMPIDGPITPRQTPVVVLHPHGRPASAPAYALPPSFKTDAQSQAAGAGSRTFVTPRAYVLPASFKSDVPSATQPTSAPTNTVVHEIRTVSNYGSRTLAIVLASAALGIALFGTGYALSRVALLQRRVVGSS